MVTRQEAQDIADGIETWERLDSSLLKFDKPIVVKGTYRGTEDVSSKFGPGKIHTLDAADGPVSFFSPSVLQRILTQRIKPGDEILIKYNGATLKTAGGRDAKAFEVQVRRHRVPVVQADGDVPS